MQKQLNSFQLFATNRIAQSVNPRQKCHVANRDNSNSLPTATHLPPPWPLRLHPFRPLRPLRLPPPRILQTRTTTQRKTLPSQEPLRRERHRPMLASELLTLRL